MSTSANLPSGSLINHGQPLPTSGHAAASPLHASGAQPADPPDEALQKAIKEYTSKLSDDDKTAFKSAFQSAPDVIEDLRKMQRDAKSPISSSWAPRVERVLQCIKSFMGSLSIFIQQSPEISSLVVGGVNCILTVGITVLALYQNSS